VASDVGVMVAAESLSNDIMEPTRYNSRPWHLLIIDFAGATTMHGIRFLAEPTKFLTRRFNTTCIFRIQEGGSYPFVYKIQVSQFTHVCTLDLTFECEFIRFIGKLMVKTCQFATKYKCDRVIALKQTGLHLQR